MGFVKTCVRFPVVQNFENRLRLDKICYREFNGGNFFGIQCIYKYGIHKYVINMKAMSVDL